MVASVLSWGRNPREDRDIQSYATQAKAEDITRVAFPQGMGGALGARLDRKRRRQRSLVSHSKLPQTVGAPCCSCEPHRVLAARLKDYFSAYLFCVGEAQSLGEHGAMLPEAAFAGRWSSAPKTPLQNEELSHDYAMAHSLIDKLGIYNTHLISFGIPKTRPSNSRPHLPKPSAAVSAAQTRRLH